MLLANALSVHFFGRGWRVRPDDPSSAAAHRALVQWFADLPSEECPFSIHAIVARGRSHGVVAGKWMAPGVLCQALSALITAHRPGGLAACVVAGEDGGFGGGAPTLHKSTVLDVVRAAVSSGLDLYNNNNVSSSEHDENKKKLSTGGEEEAEAAAAAGKAASGEGKEEEDGGIAQRRPRAPLSVPGVDDGGEEAHKEQGWAPLVLLVPLGGAECKLTLA